MSIMTECKECGCVSLTWQTSHSIRTEVPQGRLNTSDVECQFVLGCDNCSETLAVVSAEKVVSHMNNQAASKGWNELPD